MRTCTFQDTSKKENSKSPAGGKGRTVGAYPLFLATITHALNMPSHEACPKFHKLRSHCADFFTRFFGFRICKYLLFKYLNFNFFFISQLDISFSHAWILHPFFISLGHRNAFPALFDLPHRLPTNL